MAADGRARQVLLIVAMVAFVGLAVASIRASDLDADRMNWWVLGPTAVLGPSAMIALNALEFRAQARLVGVAIDPELAVRTSVFASAANLLPVPGAIVVRMKALTGRGVGAAMAGWTTAVVGQVWAATSSFVAAVGFAFNGHVPIAAGAVAVGSAFAVTARITMKKLPGSSVRDIADIAAVEFAIVVVGGARLYLGFVGFDIDVSVGQVAALTVSSVVASAAGVFPGGLGLREALIGLAGGIVGVDLASAVVIASFDRAVSLVVLGLCAAALLASTRLRSCNRTSPVSDPPSRLEPDESK